MKKELWLMKHHLFVLITIAALISISACTKKKDTNPILILANQEEFGTYTAELLKAEGFNLFQMVSPDSKLLNTAYLKQFDLVILAEGKADTLLTAEIENYVKKGGQLIAFRPDPVLSDLFGIELLDGSISEGYIWVEPNNIQSTGITTQAMQFHGTADFYALKTAKNLAIMFADKIAKNQFPAVTSNNYGKGHALAFLYNLPKSIVYTRQGNPLSAGMEKDGIYGLRGMDLFTDGWLDTATNILNQADQQMALLTNCIQNLNQITKPLPRFWYFPDSLKCLAVLDNDGEDSNEADFDPQFCDVDSMGAKMTVYFKDVDKVSKEWVDKWTAKGFEIAAHPDDTKNAAHPTWNSMDSALTIKIKEIKTAYGLSVRTNVNHWFVWCGTDENGKQDFGAQARLEEKHGIEMDANYAIYDINSNQPEHYLGTLGTNQGNFTGSGLVMKYADVSGKTINVYQRFNAIYDQQYNEGGSAEKFFEGFKGLVDRSHNEDIYSMVSIKSHNNEYYFSKEPLMKMLEYANNKGVPVWTAIKLLDFLKMKDEASFTNISWSKDILSFTLNSTLKHSNSLTFMVPSIYSNKKIESISKDGRETDFSIHKVKGVDYAFVLVQGGSNYNINVKYQ